MRPHTFKLITIVAVIVLSLLFSESAHAFRCGSKIVRVDMHEQEVIKVCGKPTTMRYLGRAVRHYDAPIVRRHGPGWTHAYYPGWGHLVQEVIVTEYVYNFGPRKLMRRLLFEGGVLVQIETLGYGYNEK